MATSPENPTMNAEQRPAQRGSIRKDSATKRLEWFDPVSQTWGPAVRLDVVRAKFIKEAAAGGRKYKHPKAGNEYGEDDLNVTSFLEKDESYGYSRDDRPEILFTLNEPDDRKYAKPTGYLMDGDRVCLDPYLHGIRDFPELPKTISADLDGQDLEYYYRQNGEISRYDIMARMPSTHTTKGTTYDEPPSLNALTQRASRFRAKAGCLMWDSKGKKKNEHILRLLPDECKKPEVNSTRAMAEDLDMRKPAESGNPASSGSVTLPRAQAENTHQSLPKSRRTTAKDSTTPKIRHEGSLHRPHSDEMGAQDTSSKAKGKKRVIEEVSSDSDPDFEEYQAPAKRQKGSGAADNIDKLKNGGTQDISSDFDSEIAGEEEPFAEHREAGEGAGSGSKFGELDTKRSRATRRVVQEQINAESLTHEQFANDEQPQPSDPVVEDQDAAPIDSPVANRRFQPTRHANVPETPQAQPKVAHDPTEATGVLTQYVIEMVDDTDPMYEAKFQAETDKALALKNPDYRYKTPHGRDTDIPDRANVRRALELTCIDFCHRKGYSVPSHLLNENHNESYMSQYRRIQAEFDRVWMGVKRVKLYCLPAWTKGFKNWKVPRNDSKGQDLKHAVPDEHGRGFHGLLSQEKQLAKIWSMA